ncbi:NAD(P)/FAD-dependent oxidoreductase [Granulicella tundricola]|uniref:FAD dependent oxidoreductase n=1 Tax=Granulicella tundricola (strain ATCC BAA-1859 / DSM 23138 / MP5ACTX9) TaxID=1198114 RepID=E8X2V3_GRATM|nr:FAD-dependent oxidoreductase [Granulicella tundricola]ADW68087.1 FAD dependent oxidoreductase [Granulicella tundricola MP5ACTX9]
MAEPDYVIAGAGIIGLSLALELHRRGASVVVLEAGTPMAQASTAAAGMLAADDPHNPIALHALAKVSTSLYPGFLDHISDLSGVRIPFQTASTLQAVSPDADFLSDPKALVPQLEPGSHRFSLLDERSVDPRQLAEALLMAVRNTRKIEGRGIDLRENTPLTRIAAGPASVRVETPAGSLSAGYFVDCMGAWSPAPVAPRKGQMLAVTLPKSLPLKTVIRTEKIYIVPRTDGPNAGRAIIGATVENAGYDLKVHPVDILTLNAQATALLPELAEALFVESWAGLRPATRDDLPILGPSPRQPRYVLANGHFRNGILLAPATAHVVAQLLMGENVDVDLAPFDPGRF